MPDLREFTKQLNQGWRMGPGSLFLQSAPRVPNRQSGFGNTGLDEPMASSVCTFLSPLSPAPVFPWQQKQQLLPLLFTITYLPLLL